MSSVRPWASHGVPGQTTACQAHPVAPQADAEAHRFCPINNTPLQRLKASVIKRVRHVTSGFRTVL